MSKRMLSLWLVSCVFAGPAFGQSISFVDAQGQSVTAYREGERVNVRLVAPAANWPSNSIDEAYVIYSARDSGDQESLSLFETGPDTRVFEGSIRLGFGPVAPQNGVLQTARPAGATGPLDRISVTFQDPTGPVVTAEADVTGPVLSFFNAGGEEVTAAVLGFRLYVRAVDASANGSNAPDTDTVRLAAGGDEEFLTLHETEPYTGVFEGSIPLAGTGGASGDGTLQATPDATVEARLEDGSGGLFAAAQVPTTERLLSFRDADGALLSALMEGSSVRLHLLDANLTYPFPRYATAVSALTGDQEEVNLEADPANPGLFKGTLQLTRSSSSPYDGLLRAIAYTPSFPDTVTATACPYDCTSVSAPTARSVTRLVDAGGADVAACAVGSPVRVRVFSPAGFSEAYVRLESLTTGDTLDALFLFDANGIAEGEVPTAPGTAAADGVLQVQPGEILRASYLNAVAQPETSDTARVSAALLEIVDAAGSPVDRPLLGAPLFLRAAYPGANTDPGQAETVSARIDVNRDHGFYRDRETLTLTETGPDTGVFTGSIPLEQQVQLNYPPNGILESGHDEVPPYHPDVIRATLADASVSAAVTIAKVQFVNGQGSVVASYLEESLLHFRVEAPLFDQPGQQDFIAIEIRSQGGDWEWTYLSETGTDTGIFTGAMPSGTGSVSQFSGILDVQAGDTLEALLQTRNGSASSRAAIVPVAPPSAQDDTASTVEDTPVTVNVLANDSDPNGLPLTVTAASADNGSTVTINPDSTITFTPYPENGGYTETVTYTVSNGFATDTATLSVWIEPVNDPPVAVDDAANVIEDSYVVLDLISNDDDPDGEEWRLEVISIGPAAHGTLALDPLLRNQYRYTPNPDFGSSLAKDVQVGPDVQVTLDSFWAGQ
ncbi:MAG TPA: cadherin-like domain-containing protein [Thermoanaerobaculia bacterium]|jgi:hypothetical protein|nr:cadherin-like domain-containing protein [Thermoanaerobaculia bacterium]